MRTRTAVLLALVAALVLGVASMAYAADATPTLTAPKTRVTYPHSAPLVSTTTTASVVYRRLAGSENWVAWKPVRSGVAKVWAVSPKSTAGYKVVSDGVESDVVTISVAAQLSKPQVNKYGRRWHKLTLKGWVAPRHIDGTVTVKFFRLQKTGEATVTVRVKGRHGKTWTKTKKVATFSWIRSGDPIDVKLTRKNQRMSKWAYRWTPTKKGVWKVVVSHEDVAHVRSSTNSTFVVRR